MRGPEAAVSMTPAVVATLVVDGRLGSGRMQQGRSPEAAVRDDDVAWEESGASGFDAALADLEAPERRAEAERRMRYRAACEFLAAFYKSDVASAQTLKDRGVATGFQSDRIAFAKAGRPAEVAIVATRQGHLSVLFAPSGRRDLMQRTDVGEFDPLIKSALRKQMIRLVIGYLGVGG